MAVSAKSINLVTFLFSLVSCSRPVYDAAGIGRAFAADEYIPSRGLAADGWAEARRRRLLRQYLDQGGFTASETAIPLKSNPGSKYRDVILTVAGMGNGSAQVSLALNPRESGIPGPLFRAAQANCDVTLMKVLQSMSGLLKKKRLVEFVVTENCIDLTEREPAED